jgi:hypothetical protein
VAFALFFGCAGAPALTPRLEDAAAPRDFYHSLVPPKPSCARAVPVLEPAEVGGRAFHEVSSISATCSPGSPSVCQEQLSERACELHADALIMDEPASGGTPPGASAQSAIALSARAVVWDGSN